MADSVLTLQELREFGLDNIEASSYRTSFLWVVKNFANLPSQSNNVITSSTFKVEEEEWEMCLKKAHDNFEFRVHARMCPASAYLVLKDTSVSILDGNFAKHSVKLENAVSNVCCFTMSLDYSEYLTSVNSEYTKVLFSDEHLILCGTLHFNNSCSQRGAKSSMDALLKSGSFHDFTIVVNETPFPCHKAILACRSKYFEALFKSEMKEKCENNLILEDIEPDVFRKVLHFIYTDEIVITENDVVHLLAAAEKYFLCRLKAICEKELFSYFTFQNIDKIFQIARMYDLQALKRRALFAMEIFKEEIQKTSLQPNEFVGEDTQCEVTPKIVKPSNNEAFESKTCIDLASEHAGQLPYLPNADVWCYTENVLVQEDVKLRDFYNTLENKNYVGSWCKRLKIKDKLVFDLEISIRKRDECGRKDGSGNERYLTMMLTVKTLILSTIELDYTFKINNLVFETGSLCLTKRNGTAEILRTGIDCYIGCSFMKLSATLECTFMTRMSVTEDTVPSLEETDTLWSNISSLQMDDDSKDLVIRIDDGIEFRCHKAVAISRWPFLEKKLNESEDQSVLDFHEIDAETLKKYLLILYNNKFEFYENKAELLPVACQFQMDPLILWCEDGLIEDLEIGNLFDIFELSRTCCAERLRKVCIKIAAKYLIEIIKENGLSEVLKHDDLTSTLLANYADASISKKDS